MCIIMTRGHYRISSALETRTDCCNINLEKEFHFVFLMPFAQCVVPEVVFRSTTVDLMWLNNSDGPNRVIFDNKVMTLATYLEKF